MSDKIQASAQREADGCVIQLWVHDPVLLGKRVKLKVEQFAKVKRSSPAHKRRVLAEREFELRSGQNRLALGSALDDVFSYTGSKLDLQLLAHIEIDDGLIFDTELKLDLGAVCRLPARTSVPAVHRHVHSPRDRFNFFANLRAIPAKARVIVIWLVALGLPVMAVNALVGVRDQFVPGSQVWFYDHRDSDGDSESPLMKALIGSGGVGLALWVAIRRQLQEYMRFEAKLPKGAITPDTRLNAADLISGQALVALQQAQVRVVAYNREHGQYTAEEKDGKRTRTVTRSFTENARGIVLYEQLLAYVPAHAPLRAYVDGEIDFAPLFEALYPPYMLDGTHGLSLRIEAQLLHPQYVDHEVELDPGALSRGHFYRNK